MQLSRARSRLSHAAPALALTLLLAVRTAAVEVSMQEGAVTWSADDAAWRYAIAPVVQERGVSVLRWHTFTMSDRPHVIEDHVGRDLTTRVSVSELNAQARREPLSQWIVSQRKVFAANQAQNDATYVRVNEGFTSPGSYVHCATRRGAYEVNWGVVAGDRVLSFQAFIDAPRDPAYLARRIAAVEAVLRTVCVDGAVVCKTLDLRRRTYPIADASGGAPAAP